MKFNEYEKVATSIEKLYAKMDKQNDDFARMSGLGCVSTCGGVCCANKEVEVSPVDLIPLVVSLIKNNSLDSYLQTAQQEQSQACLFFKQGKCSIYPVRATLCRLFGYSSVYDKTGAKTLAICSLIKEANCKEVCPVQVEAAPNLVDYAQQVNACFAGWDTNARPFNQAFIYAAERIYSAYLYEGENEK